MSLRPSMIQPSRLAWGLALFFFGLWAFVLSGVRTSDVYRPLATSRFDNVEITGTTDATGVVTARAGVRLTTLTTGPIFISGSGVPAGSATKGSLYLRTDTAQVYQNTDGATTWTQVGAAATSGGSSVFGGGYDGVVNFNGTNTFSFASLAGSTYTLNRNIAPSDMTVASGITVKVAGGAIVGNGTISGSGTIQANGNAGTAGANGSGGIGGVAPVGNFIPGGKDGGAGAINSSSSATQGTSSSSCPIFFPVANGGAGGTTGGGGAGKNGTTGGVGKGGGGGARYDSYATGPVAGARAGDVTTVVDDSVYTDLLIHGRQVGGSLFQSGTGGGGGASTGSYNDTNFQNGRGGGGGSSAGWVVVVFKTWNFTGTIEAKGGAGGAGLSFNNGGSGGSGSAGGGGGSGGVLVLIRQSGSFPTTNVTGGAGGVGGTCTGGSVNNDTGGTGGTGGVGYADLISAN